MCTDPHPTAGLPRCDRIGFTKPLLGIVAVVAVAGAGWYVLTETDDVESGSSETLGPRAVVDGNGAGGAETPNPAKHAPTPVASKPDERTLWRKLRPATEQLVPDPDKVGPCPPESSGGLGRPVVRRFIDRTTGCPTWIHDDGNRTVYIPSGAGRDPKTGEWLPGTPVVSTAVRTTPKPISPEELLQAGQDPRKGQTPPKK